MGNFPTPENETMPLGSDTLQKVLPALLRPVVRFCLNHSVKLGDLLDHLKVTFVRMAEEELQRRGERVSASRLTVLTGVHRKDVAAILSNDSGARESKSVVAKVIGAWQAQRRFVDKAGHARVLSVEGKESEFSALVRSVNVDLNPYTVLFELERIGAVERTRFGVKLANRIYLPRGDAEKGLQLLATDAEDFYRAVEQNVLEDAEVPNLHIRTEYDNIPEKHREAIRRWFHTTGSAFHQQARRFLSQFDRDTSPKRAAGAGRIRVSVGSFSFMEKLES